MINKVKEMLSKYNLQLEELNGLESLESEADVIHKIKILAIDSIKSKQYKKAEHILLDLEDLQNNKNKSVIPKKYGLTMYTEKDTHNLTLEALRKSKSLLVAQSKIYWEDQDFEQLGKISPDITEIGSIITGMTSKREETNV